MSHEPSLSRQSKEGQVMPKRVPFWSVLLVSVIEIGLWMLAFGIYFGFKEAGIGFFIPMLLRFHKTVDLVQDDYLKDRP